MPGSEKRPRLPRRICVADLADGRGAARALCDDFCGALACYAGPDHPPVARWSAGEPAPSSPVDADGRGPAEETSGAAPHPGTGGDEVPGTPATCPVREGGGADAVVIAAKLPDAARAPDAGGATSGDAGDIAADGSGGLGAPPAKDEAIGTLIGSLAACGAAAPGARVYLIALVDGEDLPEAALARAARACGRCGLVWAGGIALAGGRALPRLMASPRLGMFRRPVARSVDSLVAAVRLGCTMRELPAALGRDASGAPEVVLVPSRPWYRWFARP